MLNLMNIHHLEQINVLNYDFQYNKPIFVQ